MAEVDLLRICKITCCARNLLCYHYAQIWGEKLVEDFEHIWLWWDQTSNLYIGKRKSVYVLILYFVNCLVSKLTWRKQWLHNRVVSGYCHLRYPVVSGCCHLRYPVVSRCCHIRYHVVSGCCHRRWHSQWMLSYKLSHSQGMLLYNISHSQWMLSYKISHGQRMLSYKISWSLYMLAATILFSFKLCRDSRRS